MTNDESARDVTRLAGLAFLKQSGAQNLDAGSVIQAIKNPTVKKAARAIVQNRCGSGKTRKLVSHFRAWAKDVKPARRTTQ